MLFNARNFRILGVFILHLLVGTWGIIVTSAFLTFSLYSMLHHWNPALGSKAASSILTKVPGFPVQVTVGISVGFLIGKYTRSAAILWTWVLPLVFLCGAMVLGPTNPGSLFVHYFGNGCEPANLCVDQFVFTLPCLASAGYALGAWTARIPLSARSSSMSGKRTAREREP